MTLLAVSFPVLVAVLLGAWDLWRRPHLRKIALRSITRRTGETALVVLGAALGTAVIMAAAVVGDSVDASIRDEARARFGPIDVEVSLSGRTDLDHELGRLADDLRHRVIVGATGQLTARRLPVVISNGSKRPDRFERDCALEVDMTDARRFGATAAVSGADQLPRRIEPGTVVMSSALARLLGTARGDDIQVWTDGQPTRRRVIAVVDDTGVAGHCGIVTAPGDVAVLADRPERIDGLVWITAGGRLVDDQLTTTRVANSVERYLGTRPGLEVTTPKRDVLEDAESGGESLRAIFSGVGGFSVVAGLVLVANLCVMVAEERRREHGIARAVGLRRIDLWRVMSIEGVCIAVASAVLGVGLGIGLGAAVVRFASGVLSDPDGPGLRLALLPPSLALSAAIGASTTVLVIWVVTARTARAGVIAAIRDLPTGGGSTRRHPVAAGVLTATGAALTIWGWRDWSVVAVMIGPPLVAIGAALMVPRRFRPPTRFAGALATVAWGISVPGLGPTNAARPDINVFVVMGILCVAASLVAAMAAMGWWAAPLRRSRRPWVRLGVSHPLARPGRTGLISAPFALVVFTMTFVATFSTILESRIEAGTSDVSAGRDLVIDAGRSGALDPAQVLGIPGVRSVAPIVRGGARFRAGDDPEPQPWALSGVDRSFADGGAPRLSSRDPRFDSDAAAFRALAEDPGVIIVNDRFLDRGDVPGRGSVQVGQRFTALAPDGDRELTVIGVMRTDALFLGAVVSDQVARQVIGPSADISRILADVTAGTDPERVVRRLDRQLGPRGAEVRTIRQRVTERIEQTTSFLSVLQAYMGFGLVIGIAGLAVSLVRAVRDRRRELAMLRAMGIGAAELRRAITAEAMGIAGHAVAIGIGLGLLTAWQVVVNSTAFGDTPASFAVSLPSLAVIAVLPLVATLLATRIPARRAARVRPAVALRVSD